MNFPDYYGENMDAWIDCVEDLANEIEESLVINIKHGKFIKDNNPDILEAILECSAFINNRRLNQGEKPNIIVSANF